MHRTLSLSKRKLKKKSSLIKLLNIKLTIFFTINYNRSWNLLNKNNSCRKNAVIVAVIVVTIIVHSSAVNLKMSAGRKFSF